MQRTDAIIIGGGQAGLALSHSLGQLGISHVVLERGRIAERWRSERWDSLRLLTPNWMSRFPGWSYQGNDADGFMTAGDYAAHLEQYAASFAAPVVTEAAVRSVRRVGRGYRVVTDQAMYAAPCVVIATGHCDVPLVPAMARSLPTSIRQLTPSEYRNPAGLPDGNVLVVGASASGVQLADEIRRSGREVTISVGRHLRLPRRYRGRDIMWWLDHRDIQGDSTEADLRAARLQPSMQLVGRADQRDLDLGVLHRMGVRVVGGTVAVDEAAVQLDNDLADTMASSQTRMERLLDRIDRVAETLGAPAEDWPSAIALDEPPTMIDLSAENIRTVMWATGFKRNYDWLHVPVVDTSGEIIHTGGVTPSAGLYVAGLRFLCRRDASFIGGVAADAAELSADIQRHLHAKTHIAA